MSDPETQAPQWWAAAARVIVGQLEYLPAVVAAWEARSDTRPDAKARHAGSDAIDIIDDAPAALHALRASLIAQIRTSDDAHAARVDELLARGRPGAS